MNGLHGGNSSIRGGSAARNCVRCKYCAQMFTRQGMSRHKHLTHNVWLQCSKCKAKGRPEEVYLMKTEGELMQHFKFNHGGYIGGHSAGKMAFGQWRNTYVKERQLDIRNASFRAEQEERPGRQPSSSGGATAGHSSTSATAAAWALAIPPVVNANHESMAENVGPAQPQNQNVRQGPNNVASPPTIVSVSPGSTRETQGSAETQTSNRHGPNTSGSYVVPPPNVPSAEVAKLKHTLLAKNLELFQKDEEKNDMEKKNAELQEMLERSMEENQKYKGKLQQRQLNVEDEENGPLEIRQMMNEVKKERDEKRWIENEYKKLKETSKNQQQEIERLQAELKKTRSRMFELAERNKELREIIHEAETRNIRAENDGVRTRPYHRPGAANANWRSPFSSGESQSTRQTGVTPTSNSNHYYPGSFGGRGRGRGRGAEAFPSGEMHE